MSKFKGSTIANFPSLENLVMSNTEVREVSNIPQLKRLYLNVNKKLDVIKEVGKLKVDMMKEKHLYTL